MGPHIYTNKFSMFVEPLEILQIDCGLVVFEESENGPGVLQERLGVTTVCKHFIDDELSSASFYYPLLC